jgi:NAD(P)-dependent dehydrogenase (short-subunit alcohol dehydrogenase family)
MDAELSGKVIAITGASAGVGRATARAFAAAGADVGLLSREGDGLDSVRAEIERSGRRALAVPTDVADPDAVEAAAERIESELGEVDIWVNDAMATMFARVWDIEPAEIRRATEVTFLGAVYGTMAALKRMRPRNRGKIIQIGSALAYRAIPLQSSYCSSKFALRGFTDSLRCELMNDGSAVGVTMVHLPGLNTPQFTWVRVRGLERTPRPVPPVYQPEVAAEGVLLAARTNRREVWVGGSTVATIIGNRIAPKAADLYLAATNVKAQQTDDPVADDRRDYLFSPLPGDRGAHGQFDDEASGRSLQLLATTHRRALGAAAVVIAAGTAAVLKKMA